MTMLLLEATPNNISDSKFQIVCSLKNNSPHDIFLFSELWKFSREGKLVPECVPLYCSMSRERVLCLGSIIHPLPRNKFVEVRNIPFATLLRPGETWNRSFELEVPVREHNPYYVETAETIWDEICSSKVSICIDYIVKDEEQNLIALPLNGVFRMESPELLESVRRINAVGLDLEIPTLVRRDKFERFECNGLPGF